MADNTVFDSVFKTLIHNAPQLVIPFINETFGRDYPDDAQVVQFSNEHEGFRGTIIDDTVFRVEDKIYHIECQSTPDSNMVIRMIEYDFAIALEGALVSGAPYELDFPASCVLFLRHTASTPDVLKMKVNLPDGDSFEYRARVVKAQLYSSAELFEKRLLILLPYYLMRYERKLAEIEASDDYSAQLVNECAWLRVKLDSVSLQTGDTVLYEELIELIIKVSDHLLAAHASLQKRVREAMGGEVLELWHDRAARMEREALEQGLEQGIEQGIEQGANSLAELLKQRGIDDEVLAEALADLQAQRESKR